MEANITNQSTQNGVPVTATLVVVINNQEQAIQFAARETLAVPLPTNGTIQVESPGGMVLATKSFGAPANGFTIKLKNIPEVASSNIDWQTLYTEHGYPNIGETQPDYLRRIGHSDLIIKATQWSFDLGAISFDPGIAPYLPPHTLGVNEIFTFNTTVPAGALMHLFVGSDTAILVNAFNLPVGNGKAYVFNCLTLQLETL